MTIARATARSLVRSVVSAVTATVGTDPFTGYITVSDSSPTEGDTVTLTWYDTGIFGELTATDTTPTEGDTVTLEFTAVSYTYQWIDGDDGSDLPGEITNSTDWVAALNSNPPRLQVTNSVTGKTKTFSPPAISVAENVNPTPILDTVTGAAVAWAPDKYRTAYAGDAMLLRRSSDDAEQAFGFAANNYIDVDAIATWAGGSDIFVKTLYGQEGSGLNITQATASKQAKLVIDGGNACMLFDGVDDNYAVTTSISGPLTICFLYQGTSNFGRIVDGGGADETFVYQSGSFAAQYCTAQANTIPASFAPESVVAVFNGASSRLEHGAGVTSGGNPGSGNMTGVRLGCAFTESLGFFDGRLYGVIIYPRALTSEEAAAVHAGLRLIGTQSPSFSAEGDSLTSGTGATAGNDYPSQALASLTGWVKQNLGNAGDELVANILPNVITSSFNYLTSKRTSVFVIWAGTNDILASVAEQDIKDALTDIWTQARARNGKVVACTIIARGNFDAGQETIRQSINTWIRTQTAAYDALADFAALPQFDAQGDTASTTYYSDTVHCTDAGYAIIAGTAVTAIQAAAAA